MKIGAALVLIAVGAILRFALTTVVTHGINLHTVGEILMIVGGVGLILWLSVWAPWARGRSETSRRYTSVRSDGYSQQPGSYIGEERRYEDQYPS
ncbi:MAG TPA: hypothetical protein VEV63_10250 [Streptosporangiaceae bacterium]|nr:hypothetical protein [Streptosporangiaceae bacterium]